jgi:hypothetical protein
MSPRDGSHKTIEPHRQWRSREEWMSRDWNRTRGNTNCKECIQQCHEHGGQQGTFHRGGTRSKERGRESLSQKVLICQSVDTRLKGDDRDSLGTVTLTVKDLRRILTHGQQYPFFTVKKREEGGDGHWETRMWETCDIKVWDTTRDLA